MRSSGRTALGLLRQSGHRCAAEHGRYTFPVRFSPYVSKLVAAEGPRRATIVPGNTYLVP